MADSSGDLERNKSADAIQPHESTGECSFIPLGPRDKLDHEGPMKEADSKINGGSESELMELADSLSPQFQSNDQARAFFATELGRLASSNSLSIDELVSKAQASPKNDDLTITVLSLARKISLLESI